MVGLICPDGFFVNDAGNGCVPYEYDCEDGYHINLRETACVPIPGSIISYPFLILTTFMVLLTFGSYIKDN